MEQQSEKNNFSDGSRLSKQDCEDEVSSETVISDSSRGFANSIGTEKVSTSKKGNSFLSSAFSIDSILGNKSDDKDSESGEIKDCEDKSEDRKEMENVSLLARYAGTDWSTSFKKF